MLPRAMPRARAALTPLVALALGLGGCGGGDPVRRSDGTLRITVREYRLSPQDVSIPPGQVTLVVRNRGRLTHNVKVQAERRTAGEIPEDVGGTRTAQPGRTTVRSLVLEPGRYRLACTVQNHDDLGMRGTLVVEP